VGTVLAAIRDHAAVAAPVPAAQAEGMRPLEAPAPGVTAAPAGPRGGRAHRVSPLARRLAEELHVDLAAVRGTGAGGAITKADVETVLAAKAAAAPAVAPVPAEERALEAEGPPVGAAEERTAVDRYSDMRKAIAAAVSRSKREIPHYYLATDIPLHAALAWLESVNAERPTGERMLPAVLLVRAVALALREYPDFNGFWTDGAFRPAAGIHVGLAISLRGGGLVVPAIHDTESKPLDVLAREFRDVVQRARTGGLRASEMMDATITLTNLGDQGVETVFGVIYPPQVALVGFGRIAERPWAENGMLGVRPVVTCTLAADHRASDGHRGSLFLAEIARRLQNPETL